MRRHRYEPDFKKKQNVKCRRGFGDTLLLYSRFCLRQFLTNVITAIGSPLRPFGVLTTAL